MIVTTVMAVVMLAWCGVTLAVQGPANRVPLAPDLAPEGGVRGGHGQGPASPARRRRCGSGIRRPANSCRRWSPTRTASSGPCRKINEATGRQEDPLGFISHLWPGLAERLRAAGQLAEHRSASIGLLIAFGHSILAMSGEETLAQVYREVESPKLPNFKKAAFIVFVYSLALTASISLPGRAADPRRSPHEGLLRQSHRRAGDERDRAAAGPAAAERLRGGRRLPDPLRRGEHGDHRLQRRAEPGGRGRRDARLVPQAPPPLRHHATACST